MALASTTVWEVRVTGNDANGGNFNSAAAGTDYSQQDSPQATLTTASTVHTTTTQLNVNAGDYTVSVADVGNCIKISGGTATAGRYQITAVDTGNNRWTVDRSLGTSGQTCPGRLGGAAANIGEIGGAVLSSNTIYVKYNATPFDFTVNSSNVTGGYFLLSSLTNVFVQGYDSDRTLNNADVNWPTFRATANSIRFFYLNGGSGNMFHNFNFTKSASQTGVYGIFNNSSTFARIVNCSSVGLDSGFYDAAASILMNCYAESCTGTGFRLANSAKAISCVAVGCANAFDLPGSATVINCVSIDSTSNASFMLSGSYSIAINCTAVNSNQNSFGFSNTPLTMAINCLSVDPVGYSFDAASGGNRSQKVVNSASYQSSGNHQTGFTADVFDDFITLTTDPLTNYAGGDVSLNNTAGGGADLKSVGFNPFQGINTTGYLSIGAVQPDATGSGDCTSDHRRRFFKQYGI